MVFCNKTCSKETRIFSQCCYHIVPMLLYWPNIPQTLQKHFVLAGWWWVFFLSGKPRKCKEPPWASLYVAPEEGTRKVCKGTLQFGHSYVSMQTEPEDGRARRTLYYDMHCVSTWSSPSNYFPHIPGIHALAWIPYEAYFYCQFVNHVSQHVRICPYLVNYGVLYRSRLVRKFYVELFFLIKK